MQAVVDHQVVDLMHSLVVEVALELLAKMELQDLMAVMVVMD